MSGTSNLKVLVMEDELLVRVGIKSSIDWEGNRLTLVGEAMDGAEAIKLFRMHWPDIVLLDIRLPDMSGLDVLRIIRAEKPDTKVIVISGLDDFSTTREAFQLGAYEYFHKPRIQAGDLLKRLVDIRDLIELERCPEEKTEKPLTARALLRDVLSFSFSDEITAQLNAQIPARAYLVMMVSLSGIYAKKQKLQSFNAEIAFNAATSLISELASRRSSVEFFSTLPGEYFFLFRTDDLDENLKDTAWNFFESLSGMLNRYIDMSPHAGISEERHQFEELPYAILEAREANDRYFISNEAFSRYAQRHADPLDTLEISRLLGQLIDTARRAQVAEHLNHLNRLAVFMRKKGFLSRKALMNNAQTFIYLAGPDHRDAQGDILRLDSCETMEQFLACYKQIFMQISAKDASGFKSGIVDQIKEYLCAHYFETISLQRLSGEFHLSKSYISRVFKAESGDNLFGWLNAVRIEKSKHLLAGTPLKIYEIAEATGFKSTVSFNYAFNRVTGISPTQYKEDNGL